MAKPAGKVADATKVNGITKRKYFTPEHKVLDLPDLVGHLKKSWQQFVQEELGEISVAQAKEYMAEGQFEANTMLPKIQASVEFVEQGEGKKAVITSIDKAVDAYLGRTGTVIC